MDRKRNSEKQAPPEQPIEPEMDDKPAGDDPSSRKPATEAPKEKRSDDL